MSDPAAWIARRQASPWSAWSHLAPWAITQQLGDGACVGANAVIVPGALLAPGTVLRRLSLLDQEAD